MGALFKLPRTRVNLNIRNQIRPLHLVDDDRDLVVEHARIRLGQPLQTHADTDSQRHARRVVQLFAYLRTPLLRILLPPIVHTLLGALEQSSSKLDPLVGISV